MEIAAHYSSVFVNFNLNNACIYAYTNVVLDR